jgi:NAD(P)-dependent dehydrogenase (short-subunit alcohol dehydrogenase family)
MKAVVEEAVSKYGRLDVMFANAGVSGSLRDFRDVEADEVLGVLRTNVVR